MCRGSYRTPQQKMDAFFEDMKKSGVEQMVIMISDPDSDLNCMRYRGPVYWRIGACTHAADVFRQEAVDVIIKQDDPEDEV